MHCGWDIGITIFLLVFVISSRCVTSSMALDSDEDQRFHTNNSCHSNNYKVSMSHQLSLLPFQSCLCRDLQKRSVQYYHDSVVLNKILKNETVNGPGKKNGNIIRYRRKLQDPYSRHYPIKNMKTLPADESLRHDFYSERLENSLGNVPIQRGRRANVQPQPKPQPRKVQVQVNQPSPSKPIFLANTVRRPRIPSLPDNAVLAARVQDIEEIFRILARRDGQFLEQMLSLKSAIDRLYSIFEYMGVANMPPTQRDAAIRQVVRRAYRIDTRKLIKRRRKKFAKA